MEQIAEFFLVTAFGIRTRGPHHAHTGFFEHADDVIGGGFSFFSQMHNQLAPNLLDFRGCVTRLGQTLSNFQDQRLLCGGTTLVALCWIAFVQDGPRRLALEGSSLTASPARRWR